MKVSIAGENFSFVPKQEVEIDSELAEKWVSVGHAEYVNAPDKPKRKRSSKGNEGSDE